MSAIRPSAPSTRRGDSASGRFRRAFRQSRIAVAALAAVTIMVAAAALASLISPQDPFDLAEIDVLDATLPPGSPAASGDFVFVLGSDGQGRDIYSAILRGLQISLLIGFGSALAAALIGASLGLLAGFKGGRIDAVLMRLVDFQLSFPAILAALIIIALVGKGTLNVLFSLILVEWAYYARTARASALVESRREYIEAARGLKIPPHRILFRHLLPNCAPPLLVIGPMQVARAIALESTLSFLGLGVSVTRPSLGLLIANGHEYMLSGHYWISVFPGIALMTLIIAINLVGDRVRDILNPRNAE